MSDLLTEKECRELIAQKYVPSGVLFSEAMRLMLQRAARLGAERERERAARVCEAMDEASYPHKRVFPSHCAAAIRRGEGE